jgi:hypothetical protein
MENMKPKTFMNTGGESVPMDTSTSNGDPIIKQGATGQGWAGYSKHKSVQKDSHPKGIDNPGKKSHNSGKMDY